ncbi:MAG TPA: M1 family metallopeptidase [Puia sp.]|nr:M1 family metallopeptidase [Puia sp.]
MHYSRLLVAAFCCHLSLAAVAQSSLPLPLNIRQAVDKGTRSLTGRPGPRYWQNHADYTIRVRFDPATRLVSGSESIVYANSSPDTLRQLLFKLYPNLYKKGAQRMMAVQPEDLTDGMSVTNLAVDGLQAEPARNGRRRRAAAGTDMSIPIQALVPGRSLTVTLDFSYTLNRTSHIRTGQIDSGAYFVAYFFPRIAVYDDIDGWNRIPYLGPQEFYNDFCNFSVSVTVPGNFLVWGTGDLVNRGAVLSDIYNRRIDSAERGDGIVRVIDSADLARQGITRDPDSNTWVFDARNVTDFVFAISNHYVWKSSSLIVDPASGRRTRVDAVFNPAHRDYEEVIDFARKTVQAMSYSFPAWPYPYPHETVFDGLDQMEYPMMVNDNPLENRAEAIELTDHEIFHTFFPFYMGVNETKHAWMDEGWATIGEWIISPLIDSAIVDGYGVEPYARGAGREDDLPVITPSTQETGNDYFLNSYPKPAMGYLYAKDILGDSLFLRGIHLYMQDWHGKHPIPLDFFQSMNAGSGVNLDWFWRRWFYENGYPDLAIASVNRKKNTWTVTVANKGGKPLPVDLTIEFEDGSTDKVHRSAAVWEKQTVLTLRFDSDKTVRTVRLGSTYTPDSFPADNVMEVK